MPDEPKFAYGVWIHGQGWLKADGERPLKARVFATPYIEVANGAMWLWGSGASVMPIDASLIDLEDAFVQRDLADDANRAWITAQALSKRKWWQP